MGKKETATRGQHHLPQFLLKGFSSRTRKKQAFTWLFRRDTAPTEANIKRVAKVRDFYGGLGETNIEQQLAVLENSFANLVRHLREGSGLEDKRIICEFVASTQVRTANLRSGVASAMERFTSVFGEALMMDSTKSLLADEGFARVMARIDGGELDHLLQEIPCHQREAAKTSIALNLRGHLETAVGTMTQTIAQSMPSLNDPEAFKVSQNKLLAESLVPEPRFNQLMELDWTVHKEDGTSLILGDVGVIAGSRVGELINPLCHDPSLDAIYLPISSTRLLVGSRPEIAVPSFSVVNLASSELSQDFFIAASQECSPELHSRIGYRSELLSETEVQDIVSSAFTDFRTTAKI